VSAVLCSIRWELLPPRLKSSKDSHTPRIYEATKDSDHRTLRHGADFSLPTASLGLERPHKQRLGDSALDSRFQGLS
jgi:hypothetical protein